MEEKIVKFLKSISIFLVGMVALEVAAIILDYSNFFSLFPNLSKNEENALFQLLVYGSHDFTISRNNIPQRNNYRF